MGGANFVAQMKRILGLSFVVVYILWDTWGLLLMVQRKCVGLAQRKRVGFPLGSFTSWHRGHMWIALLFKFLLGDGRLYFAVQRRGSVLGFSFVLRH